ncbi:MAG: hypothetical protein O2983_00090 [Planctomycetota bacterium]|nr:hypothetical protein [Planctomycetota bacterium]MDA0919593.1 hypothetical protein [Planctomycetota bacterium]MDA1157979.1 hypothetical protein [Planctomycetota bacterium]
MLLEKSPLFHVLLVEDDEELNGDLKWLIEKKFPGTAVSSALYVSTAMEILNSADVPVFDIALLDVRVPLFPGGDPRTETQIADRLKESGIASVYMTSYRATDDVETFIKDRELQDPPLKVISKRDLNRFQDHVFKTIGDWFTDKASGVVHNELRRVFGTASIIRDGRSGTADLMSLQRTIIDYWCYLSEKTRREVRERFEVVEHDGTVNALRLFPMGSQS